MHVSSLGLTPGLVETRAGQRTDHGQTVRPPTLHPRGLESVGLSVITTFSPLQNSPGLGSSRQVRSLVPPPTTELIERKEGSADQSCTNHSPLQAARLREGTVDPLALG